MLCRVGRAADSIFEFATLGAFCTNVDYNPVLLKYENTIKRWEGKVALVTGASSGIGREVARALSAAGMKVALSARRAERLRALADELGGEKLVAPADLRDEAAIASMFDQVRDTWGGVDVLVNSGGLGRSAPLLEGPIDAWREMLEVNVLGLTICTKLAVEDMRRRGDAGHVFHISSMSAHRIPGDSGVYSASKFAVRALTEALRKELREAGSSVRVTAISPGYVETEFAEVYHGNRAAADETYGRFKVLQPEDIAESVIYALSAPEHVAVHDILMRPTQQRT
jgi:NADP-dependent 3-hydroxy acid dehydrogenase YdfG